MSKKYIDIKVFDGDDDIKYVRYEDMLNLLEQIRIKKEEKDREIERLNNIIDKAKNELFNLKDMIYKSETREINFDIQRKISSIIKILILGEGLKGKE